MNKRRKDRRAGPCEKCGIFRISLHRDHIVPKFKGGGDEPSNIQWICANCHEDKTREDFKGWDAPWARKPRSAEVRAKISAAKKGQPGWKHTPAQSAAISQRMRESYANGVRKPTNKYIKLRSA